MKTLANLSQKAGFVVLCLFGFFLPMVFYTKIPDQFFGPKQYFANFASLILLVLLTIHLAGNSWKIRTSRMSIPLAIWCGWCAITTLWSVNKLCTLRELSDAFLIVLFFFYVLEFIPNVRGVKILLGTMVLSGLFITFLNFLEGKQWTYRIDLKTWDVVYATDEFFYIEKGHYKYRPLKPDNLYIPLFPLAIADARHIGATTGNKNNLASVQAFLIFCTLALLFSAEGFWWRLVHFFSFLVFLAGSGYVGAASALIGIGMALLYTLFFSQMFFLPATAPIGQRKTAFFLFWGTLLAVILVFSSSNFNPTARFRNLMAMNNSFVSRVTDYRVTLRALGSNLHRLLYGYGFSSFKHVFPTLAAKHIPEPLKDRLPDGISRHAHSDWIQGFAEIGLIGMIWSLFLLWSIFHLIWTRFRPPDLSLKALIKMAGESLHYLFFGGFRHLFTSKPSTLPTGPGDGFHHHLPLVAGISAGLIAILGNALGDFPLNRITPKVYLTLAMGLLTWLAIDQQADTERISGESLPAKHFPRVSLVLPLMVVLGFVLGFRNTLHRFQADTCVSISDALMTKKEPKFTLAAAQYLFKSLTLDSLPGYAWLKFSTVAERLKNIPLAIKLAEKSLPNINLREYSMSDHSSLLQLSHLHYDFLKDPQATADHAIRGLFLTCGFDRLIFYHYLCQSSLDLGQTNLVEGLLGQWLKSPHVLLTSHLPETVEKLGYYYGSMDQWKRALELVEKPLALFPGHYRLLRLKGNALGKLGRYEEGTALLRQAREANPTSPGVLRDLGSLLFQTQAPEEGRQILESLLSRTDLPPQMVEQVKGILTSSPIHHEGTTENASPK
jgi:tetratricopeptide (TPR) repeat protein